MDVDGLLLDIDGVLAVSWEPLPGAIDTLAWLRSEGVPFRLITNTTTHPREDLAQTLRDAGFDVTPDDIVTAVVATAGASANVPRCPRVPALRRRLARGSRRDLARRSDEPADVIVIGGGCDDFSYGAMNHCFHQLMNGATLIGMHRNMYWSTSEGLQLDGGAYIAGLEEATGAMPRSAASLPPPTSKPRWRCWASRRPHRHGRRRCGERCARRAGGRHDGRVRPDREVPPCRSGTAGRQAGPRGRFVRESSDLLRSL